MQREKKNETGRKKKRTGHLRAWVNIKQSETYVMDSQKEKRGRKQGRRNIKKIIIIMA